MATHSSILAQRIPWTERILAGYSPQGRKEADTAETIQHAHMYIHYFYFQPVGQSQSHGPIQLRGSWEIFSCVQEGRGTAWHKFCLLPLQVDCLTRAQRVFIRGNEQVQTPRKGLERSGPGSSRGPLEQGPLGVLLGATASKLQLVCLFCDIPLKVQVSEQEPCWLFRLWPCLFSFFFFFLVLNKTLIYYFIFKDL